MLDGKEFTVKPYCRGLSLDGIAQPYLSADYRKYVMPVRPFTVALRAKHVGRYGMDGSDSRLAPLVWTLRDVVRGYDLSALSTRACAGVYEPDCGSLEYRRSNRMFIGNAELRFPVLGAFRRNAQYGPLPVEGLMFADAGVFSTAWPITSTTSRAVLRSVGAGIRLNAAGAVFELNGVRRFGPAQHGWTFAFNSRPGF